MERPEPRRKPTLLELLAGLAPLLFILGAWWVVSGLGHLEAAQIRNREVGFGNRAVGCAQALASGYTLAQLPACTEPEVRRLFDASARPLGLGAAARASRLPTCAMLRADHPDLMADLEQREGRRCEDDPLPVERQPAVTGP
jgi:hypothetical protein